MSLRERLAEKRSQKIVEKIQEEKKDVAENATSSEAMEKVRRFTSVRATLRKSLPMMIFGLILAFIEYEIIGILYTLVSLLVYTPMMYFYTKSVMPVSGKYLLVSESNGSMMTLTRYLIPDDLFELIQFDVPLMPAMIRFNGIDTYLAVQVWKLENGVMWKVKLAFKELNELEYAVNSQVLKSAVELLTNLMRLTTKLENLKEYESIIEGRRQTKTRLDLIDKAYRDDPMKLRREINELQAQINDLMMRNKDLIYGPEDEEEEEKKEETLAGGEQ